MRRLLRRLVGRLLWVERVAFFEADLTQGTLLLPALPIEVEIEMELSVATPHELRGRYRKALEGDFAIAATELNRCIEQGHLALLATRQGVPVAMTWLAFDAQQISEIGRTMQLRRGEALSYNEFTLPTWRGRGIGPRLNHFADAVARQHGVTRRITWRKLANAPALRVAQKLGHRRFAIVTTLSIAGAAHRFVFGLTAPGLPPLLPAAPAG